MRVEMCVIPFYRSGSLKVYVRIVFILLIKCNGQPVGAIVAFFGACYTNNKVAITMQNKYSISIVRIYVASLLYSIILFCAV